MKNKIKEKIQKKLNKYLKKRICKNCEFYDKEKNECWHMDNEQIEFGEDGELKRMHPMQVYATYGCNNFKKDHE